MLSFLGFEEVTIMGNIGFRHQAVSVTCQRVNHIVIVIKSAHISPHSQ